MYFIKSGRERNKPTHEAGLIREKSGIQSC